MTSQVGRLLHSISLTTSRFVLIAAVAGGLAILEDRAATAQNPSAEGERHALAAVRALGGLVVLDAENGKASCIFLLKKRKFERLTDDDIKLIDFSAFSNLKELAIVSDDITDSALSHVGKMKSQLTGLQLASSGITDKGLSRLLRTQTSLYSLTLDKAPITDAALKALSLKDLRILCMSRTKISGKGLQDMEGIKNLAFLDLSDSPITDDALPHIGSLQDLQFLSLRGTKVSDSGITALYGSRSLRKLDVSQTKVSADGQQALLKMLPDVDLLK